MVQSLARPARTSCDWLEPVLSPEAWGQFHAHVLQAAPAEACGFLALTADGGTAYQPVENIHPRPTEAFRVAAAEYLAMAPVAVALLHSHVDPAAFDTREHPAGMAPDCPSALDMSSQLAMALPWGISVTDGQIVVPPFFWGSFVLDQPLLGRSFRHGIDDCYSAIRKWYWQERTVLLPDFPRAYDWWYGDRELYLEGYAKAGFRPLDDGEPKELGDVGMVRVGDRRVKTVNHGFVYLGDGTVFHHLPGRLSRREAAGGSLRQVSQWVRFAGLPPEDPAPEDPAPEDPPQEGSAA